MKKLIKEDSSGTSELLVLLGNDGSRGPSITDTDETASSSSKSLYDSIKSPCIVQIYARNA